MFATHKSRIPKLYLLVVGVFLGCAMVGIISLYIFSASLEGFVAELDSNHGCLRGSGTLADLHQQLEVNFPDSTRILQVASEAGGRDCRIFVEFNVDPGELQDFLNSTYISLPLNNVYPAQFQGFNYIQPFVNWSFDTRQQYLFGKSNQSGVYQYIVVNIGAPQLYTAYFIISLQ